MFRLVLLSALMATAYVVPTEAAPICAEFAASDTMPKKYKRLAPVLASDPDGWIFTQDQLDVDYLPDAEALHTIRSISEEFKRLDVPLAILMAPPRPLVAGPEEVANASDGPSTFDHKAAFASFSAMVAAVQNAGVVMPDLLSLAQSDPALRDAYYFRRDTHWTPTGALHSALALAEAVAVDGVETFSTVQTKKTAALEKGQPFEERGSLSDMVKDVCGKSLAPEMVPMPILPSEEGSLFGDDAHRPRIALAGSSFSDRYKRDAYRVADALAGAFHADVVNYSVSGGGPIGGIEGLVLSGAIEKGAFDLVVWELPYTEGLSHVSFLRQLLGALQYRRLESASIKRPLIAEKKFEVATPSLLAVHAPGSDVQKLFVDVYSADGSKKTLTVSRRERVPADRRAEVWPVNLAGLPGGEVQAVKVRAKGADLGQSPQIELFVAPGL